MFSKIVVILSFLLVLPMNAVWAAGGAGSEEAEGILVVEPATPNNGVSVRVTVPQDQMLAGIRWYNGSASIPFSSVSVATGNELFPPAYSEAVVVAESVSGDQNAWCELVFDSPIASQSGTLFVILKYAPNYERVEGQPVHGVGYVEGARKGFHFVTLTGEKWYKVASQYRVLLEPILADRDWTVVSMGQYREEEEIPESALQIYGVQTYPNPFNPETRIELYLPSDSDLEVTIFDVRGRVVRRLHSGQAQAGTMVLKWSGVDESGRNVSSGVYLARVNSKHGTLNKRLVLLK